MDVETILGKVAEGLGGLGPIFILLWHYLRGFAKRAEKAFATIEALGVKFGAVRQPEGESGPLAGPSEEDPPAGGAGSNGSTGVQHMPTAEEAIRGLAAERYGPKFLPELDATAARLGVNADDLLAVIAAETSYFRANGGNPAEGGTGKPWPQNGTDGGGGLIGWTAAKGKGGFNVAFSTIARKGPVGQLADVETYYRRKAKTYGFELPLSNLTDTYLVVRAPGAVGEDDDFPIGGGLTVADAAAYIAVIAEGRGKHGPFGPAPKRGGGKGKAPAGSGAGILVLFLVAGAGAGAYFALKG